MFSRENNCFSPNLFNVASRISRDNLLKLRTKFHFVAIRASETLFSEGNVPAEKEITSRGKYCSRTKREAFLFFSPSLVEDLLESFRTTPFSLFSATVTTAIHPETKF